MEGTCGAEDVELRPSRDPVLTTSYVMSFLSVRSSHRSLADRWQLLPQI